MSEKPPMSIGQRLKAFLTGWRLSTCIIVLIVVASALVGGFTWYFTTSAADATTTGMALDIMATTNDVIIGVLESRAKISKNTAFLIADLILDGTVNVTSWSATAKILSLFAKNNRDMFRSTGLYYTPLDGQSLNVYSKAMNAPSDDQVELFNNYTTTCYSSFGKNLTVSTYSPDGKEMAIILNIIDKSELLTTAEAARAPIGRGVWSDPIGVLFKYTLPVRPRIRPTLSGYNTIVVMTLGIQFVGERLQSLAESSDSISFIAIITGDFKIMGVSDRILNANLIYALPGAVLRSVYTMDEMKGNNSFLDNINAMTKRDAGKMASIPLDSSWESRTDVDGRPQFLTVTPYMMGGEKLWYIIQYVDANKIRVKLLANNGTTAIIVALVILFISTVGMIISYLISRRLKLLANDIQKLASFKFTEVKKLTMRDAGLFSIVEINHIEESFYTMVKKFAEALTANRSLMGGDSDYRESTSSKKGECSVTVAPEKSYFSKA